MAQKMKTIVDKKTGKEFSLPECQFETIQAILAVYKACIQFLPFIEQKDFCFEIATSKNPVKKNENRNLYLTVETNVVYKFIIGGKGNVIATNKITGTKVERLDHSKK